MDSEKKDMPLDVGRKSAMDSQDDILSFPPEKKTDKWSVSWSDLMMTMFVLFVVLYVFQAGDRELFFGKGPGKTALSESGGGRVLNMTADSGPSHLYDQARQAISEVMVGNPNAVDLAPDRTVRIVLAGDFLFDPGRSDLKIGARYQLDQVARVLNENDLVINVAGHTDDSPTRSDLFPTNWELSAVRAVNVARYLIETAGVDQNRIFVSAHASLEPVEENDTAENRALNRRVEIILMKQRPDRQSGE